MRRSAVTLVLLAFLGCASTIEAAPEGEIWKPSTPEEQGLDSRILLQALERVRDGKLDVHSVIVIRHGRVVLECYVHPYDRDSLHNVKSVSKSIISALTGIALERKILKNLDQKVHEFLPQYFGEGVDPRKKEIALRHLLTMTSGLDLDENGPITSAIFRSDDWVGAAFERPMLADPGERFVYSTPLTHTMSAILTEQSGMSLLELAEETLFEPLGFSEVQWRQGPNGYYFGGAELFLTPRDMARFGLLFLGNGRWMGKALVPETWVRESTRDQLKGACGDRRYGYWWWLDEDAYVAMGWGGQAIAIRPDLDMVAVATAADPAGPEAMFRGLDDYEPSDEPLPPNPEAVAAMRKLARELERPAPRPVPEPPALAAKVSGNTYVFDANPQGFREITLEFPGGSTARMTLVTPEGPLEAAVGLDGLYRISESGGYGHMPRDNRVAARGSWTDERTFTVESHEMGNPIVSTISFRFEGERLEADTLARPLGLRLEFTAKRKPAPAEKTEG